MSHHFSTVSPLNSSNNEAGNKIYVKVKICSILFAALGGRHVLLNNHKDS